MSKHNSTKKNRKEVYSYVEELLERELTSSEKSWLSEAIRTMVDIRTKTLKERVVFLEQTEEERLKNKKNKSQKKKPVSPEERKSEDIKKGIWRPDSFYKN